MKFITLKIRNLPILGLAFCLSVLFGHNNAYATSTFSSNATITYTIDSVINTTTTADDLAGLSIAGSFELDPSSEIFIPSDSDASVTLPSSIEGVLVDPVSNSFSKLFSVNGTATDGLAEASYLGLYQLTFDNTSTNIFDIQVSIDYNLDANTSGQFAENGIQLDYYNEDGSFSSGDTGYSVFASTPDPLQDAVTGGNTYSFSLGAGTFDTIYSDVEITGNLEASPVPVPAAFWLISTALTALSITRRGNTKTKI